jgi:hypothetical protein
MNKQIDEKRDLEILKNYETKVNQDRTAIPLETKNTHYKQFAYKVKNPFRGV